jgi:hypothetical protein
MWYHGETGREVFKLRLGLVAIVVFLASGWSSWKELRYGLWGRTTTATVTRVYQDREFTGKRPRTVLRVEFDYLLPDGTPQPGRLTTSRYRQIVEGQEIEVRYVPGVSGVIRLRSDANLYPMVLFGFCLLAMVGFVIWAAREAHRPYGRRPRAVDDAPVQTKVVGSAKRRTRKPLKPLQPLDEE